MIAFDFEYYKPASIAEATEVYKEVQTGGKKPMFFSGGTEFITFARVNQLQADAVIDIKGIPDCHMIEQQGNQLIIGAAVSLNKITESNLFPLLGQTVKQIADHTSRNKITLGGNLNSKLMYREGILPLLIADAKVKIAKGTEEEIVPLEAVFDQEIELQPGNFLAQIIIEAFYANLPFVSLKRTKFSKVGYPVVSVAALAKDRQIRVAFSGVCAYPFRSVQIEAILNDTSLPVHKRIDKAVTYLPAPVVNDLQGSAAYREFVLKNILLDTMEALEMRK